MTDVVTATKFTSMIDWEGIYVDGELKYENHTADISDLDLDDDVEIGDIDNREVNMNKLGINSLPNDLNDLEQMLEFSDRVVKNKSDWEENIRKVINTLDHRPDSQDFARELGISDLEFKVIEGCFKPESVRNNNTALGETAILSNAEDGSGNITSTYTLMENDDAWFS